MAALDRSDGARSGPAHATCSIPQHEDLLRLDAVSPLVNNANNEGPELLAQTAGGVSAALTLFG